MGVKGHVFLPSLCLPGAGVVDGVVEGSQDQQGLQRYSKGISRVCPAGPSFGVGETAFPESRAPREVHPSLSALTPAALVKL